MVDTVNWIYIGHVSLPDPDRVQNLFQEDVKTRQVINFTDGSGGVLSLVLGKLASQLTNQNQTSVM
jgi:hypothetical protein